MHGNLFPKELGMKVILNKDLSPLGEEGDVKDVARGYARNFLFPRNIAVPYNEHTVKLFDARRGEIDARKQEKRNDAAGLKEKLESLNLEISMPAGPNGRLYGAVTSQTVMDELAKHGHQIERKRIELTGPNIKSVGKYKVQIKLYESASAEISITVLGQEIKTETKTPARTQRRRRDAGVPSGVPGGESGQANPPSEKEAPLAAETPATEAAQGETPAVETAGTAAE
jgi:large subunit ribosomal protein L9